MTKFIEGRHPGEFILSEAGFHRSRDSVTIPESQTVTAGMLLAAIAIVAGVVATASVSAANTAGTGTIAMGTPATTTKVKDGVYKGIAVTATTVRWEDPQGKEIGVSTHGTEFSKGGVKFTITAGATPNSAGDEFYIDVAANSDDLSHVPFNPIGVDGSDVPSAVAIYGADTGVGETIEIAAITRDAEIKGVCIEWPDGITDEQKANATQALAEKGIIVR